MVSSTLYHMFSSDIGLYSAGLSDGGVVLGSRTISADFIARGTWPSFHILYSRYIVMSSPILPAPNSSSAVMESGPHAFFFFSFLRLKIISTLLGGFSISMYGGSSSSWS